MHNRPSSCYFDVRACPALREEICLAFALQQIPRTLVKVPLPGPSDSPLTTHDYRLPAHDFLPVSPSFRLSDFPTHHSRLPTPNFRPSSLAARGRIKAGSSMDQAYIEHETPKNPTPP